MINFKFALYYVRNVKLIRYPIFEDLNKFKPSLLLHGAIIGEWIHEKASKIGKICFVGYCAPWLKNYIYVVTNIGVEVWKKNLEIKGERY